MLRSGTRGAAGKARMTSSRQHASRRERNPMYPSARAPQRPATVVTQQLNMQLTERTASRSDALEGAHGQAG